jgi:hypothetical protein
MQEKIAWYPEDTAACLSSPDTELCITPHKVSSISNPRKHKVSFVPLLFYCGASNSHANIEV